MILFLIVFIAAWSALGMFIFKKYSKILIKNNDISTKKYILLMVFSGPVVWFLFISIWFEDR